MFPTLGEKENYKCLRILEVNKIKQTEIKEKKNKKKRIFKKNKKTSRNQTLL